MKKSFLFIVCCLMCVGIQAQESLPGLNFNEKPAILKGQVKGAAERGVSKVYLTYMKNLDTEDYTTDSTVLASNGTFSFKADIYYTKIVSLAFAGSGSAKVLLTPGETVQVAFDPSKLEEKSAWTFKGPNSEFNRDNANYGDDYSEAKLFRDINGAGFSKFNGFGVSEYKTYLLDTYNNAVENLESNKNIGQTFKDYVKTTYQLRTMVMLSGYSIILAYANKKDKSDYTVPENYWDEIRTWPVLSNNSVLYTTYGNNLKDFADSFVKIGCISKPTFPQTYNVLTKLLEQQAEKASIKNLTQEEKTSLNIKSIAEDLAGEDVFKALIAPYKGKPLLVDFWATWCGPCKAAMKTILPVKEELAGKVNFIYITAPTSPEATWKKMIPEIHGDHYYVTDAQWRTLLQQFESQGIPTYVVVDKDGNIVNKHIGYPGNDVIKEELTK